jgi:hypothetical protein
MLTLVYGIVYSFCHVTLTDRKFDHSHAMGFIHVQNQIKLYVGGGWLLVLMVLWLWTPEAVVF